MPCMWISRVDIMRRMSTSTEYPVGSDMPYEYAVSVNTPYEYEYRYNVWISCRYGYAVSVNTPYGYPQVWMRRMCMSINISCGYPASSDMNML